MTKLTRCYPFINFFPNWHVVTLLFPNRHVVTLLFPNWHVVTLWSERVTIGQHRGAVASLPGGQTLILTATHIFVLQARKEHNDNKKVLKWTNRANCLNVCKNKIRYRKSIQFSIQCYYPNVCKRKKFRKGKSAQHFDTISIPKCRYNKINPQEKSSPMFRYNRITQKVCKRNPLLKKINPAPLWYN